MTKLKPAQVEQTKEISFTVDGGGSVPSTGLGNAFRPVSFYGTIKSWHIVAEPSGSVVADIVKANGSKPTASNSICASAKPTLSSAAYAASSTLTGWTTAVVPGDIFGLDLESISTITNLTVTIVIELTKNY